MPIATHCLTIALPRCSSDSHMDSRRFPGQHRQAQQEQRFKKHAVAAGSECFEVFCGDCGIWLAKALQRVHAGQACFGTGLQARAAACCPLTLEIHLLRNAFVDCRSWLAGTLGPWGLQGQSHRA